MAPLTLSRGTANAGNPSGDFVIVIDCPDRPGIVHAVSGFLVEHGGNIVESQQFGDRLNGRFFMRIDFSMADDSATVESRCAPTSPRWRSGSRCPSRSGRRAAPYRTLIMVSKQLHCLNDLLFRASTGSLQIEIPVVVSNHLDAEPLVRSYGIDFRHIPVTAGDQAGRRGRAAEAARGPRHPSRRARPLHAGALRRRLPRAVGPGDQHPPLVPAELQGRQALPPGLRPRGEADRRDRALRDRRPRRGPDHRAGRDPRRPQPRPGPARRRRPRRRGPGAVPRRALALRVDGCSSTATGPVVFR